MGALDELAGSLGEGPAEETDELGAHLRVMLGKPATPEMKAAFKAAVHACMDEYGPEPAEDDAMIE